LGGRGQGARIGQGVWTWGQRREAGTRAGQGRAGQVRAGSMDKGKGRAGSLDRGQGHDRKQVRGYYKAKGSTRCEKS